MGIRRRLEILEARTPPPAPARPGGVTWSQLQALDARIRRQEAGDEVGPAPEADFMKGMEPDHEIVAILRQIELLEEMEDRRGG